MPFVDPKLVEQARKMDLLTYLKVSEPEELRPLSGNTYTTKTHDSLKISNGKWMWWSRGFGGISALDYLIKVKEIPFTEAVGQILALGTVEIPDRTAETRSNRNKSLCLPDRNAGSGAVVRYLTQRGIAENLIRHCIETGQIYESKPYYNVVFVGFDENRKPRFAALRGTRSDFIGEASGSDKRYSFSLPADRESEVVHVFESAIDLLSYATCLQMREKEVRAEHLVSLAGIYQPGKESKIPDALMRYLSMYPRIRSVHLHLDNDKAGREAAGALVALLKNAYEVRDMPPPFGKDVNDYLCRMKHLKPVTRQKMKEAPRERG